MHKISFKSPRSQWVNSLRPSDAIWWHRFWVNIGSDNGLLPDGTKPLPESTLTYHQEGLVAFIWGQFRMRYLTHHSLKLAWNYVPKISFKSPRGQWVKSIILRMTAMFPRGRQCVKKSKYCYPPLVWYDFTQGQEYLVNNNSSSALI